MSGFYITITDAGRAALINAQNTGTNAFVLSQVGVSTQAVPGPLAALTALPNETKRLATMAGDVVANDTLHVTIRDESNSAYALRAFGLYTSTGVLFAVYSQTDPIIEKSSAAMLLLAVDARLLSMNTEQVEFGPVGFTLPPASETVAGISEVATDAEADAGTDNWRYITPRLLKRALGALSGFAAIGHKHVAADITSGTFNVARIPALAMDKITGLVDALAGKAATVHTHTIAQIEGLSAALAAKAGASHAHDAGDITSGTFSVARIPSLAMDKITGLFTALAGKADTGHTHAASDVTSGTFSVARIPSLAMDKISGLVTALAEKADVASSFVMRASLGTANNPNNTFTPGAYRQATNANAQLADGYPVANDGGTLLVYNPSSNTGLQTYHARSNGRCWSRSFHTGTFAPWVEHYTTANLKPAATDAANQFDQPQLITNSAGGSSQRLEGRLLTLSNFAPGILFEDRSANVRNALISVDSSFLNIWTDEGDGQYSTLVTRISLVNPTAPSGDSSVRLASTEFVANAVAGATAGQYRGNTGTQPVTPDTVWSAAQIQTISQASTLAVNLAAGLNFTTTMTGNRTLGAPSNGKPGQSGVIQIIQDGTGGRTLAFASAWKFANGIVPTLSTAAGARDILVFTVIGSGDVVASLLKDVRR